jgi:trehalose 6-phosphate synthase
MLPWRQEVLAGMLGSDLIGFQTADDVANFAATSDKLLQTGTDGHKLVLGPRQVEVDAFPISVDFAHWDELGAEAVDDAKQLRDDLGVDTVLLGIDRLDYTKGITQRLQAYAELLQDGRFDPTRSTFVQVAVPTRSDVPAYQDERSEVEALVDRINSTHRRPDGSGPVQYIESGFDDRGLAAWYRAADALVVTSLADGMNLVAKEFVAARGDSDGVVVLSEFAGAAQDLDRALIVNPYDIDAIKGALVAALEMTPSERTERMNSMRDTVRRNDVQQWARQFLERLDAAAAQGNASQRWHRTVLTRLRGLVPARRG